MDMLVDAPVMRAPLGWNGRTLKQMLEDSERLVAETGRYNGLDYLKLQTEQPILYEKIFSRLRGGLVNARSTALNIPPRRSSRRSVNSPSRSTLPRATRSRFRPGSSFTSTPCRTRSSS
ncbi:hypothetical protein HNP73_003121 [Amaricoccus macauensis]|uniref:Uncharacterized protein n=1 Tax=Amaricoccus macauensis TaxID=57001 RepID=A0A840SQ25_9RHOB|nr:hypothetical protein [Amaricoccus macauensis]MBB5223174.1 hypothetical protein [Amaricoccus macauensis]